MTRVAILNSRQSKTPVGNDPWVMATLAAVEHAAQSGFTIVSSFSPNTWDLVTWAAGRSGAQITLICPEDTSIEARADLLRRFELRNEFVEWDCVQRGGGHSQSKNWWEERDTKIISSADILLPVCIRKGGRLDDILSVQSVKSVDERFRVPHSPAPHHLRFDISPGSVNPAIRTWDGNWLIHWTRASNSPWPGETDAGFYAALVNSGDSYCRAGFHTLSRILQERRIRASAWKIGSGVPVVAFTELTPIKSIALMRWRPRWSRWSIEPYGIAIHRNAAESLGLRPVQYVENSKWDSLPVEEKPFSHVRGKKADVWPAEREWRLAGDAALALVPSDQIRVIVRTNSEREAIAMTCNEQVSSFE